MEAVDEYVPTPERDTDKPFMMPVEDVFSITGRGTVATGRVERGQVDDGDEVDTSGLVDEAQTATVAGVGTVATGRVERGQVEVGDEVEIIGLADEAQKTTVTGVEMFRKLLDYAEAGDNIGALLRGVEREDVKRGQVLAAPSSITPHTKFQAEVYVLSKEEGGRHTPFFDN